MISPSLKFSFNQCPLANSVQMEFIMSTHHVLQHRYTYSLYLFVTPHNAFLLLHCLLVSCSASLPKNNTHSVTWSLAFGMLLSYGKRIRIPLDGNLHWELTSQWSTICSNLISQSFKVCPQEEIFLHFLFEVEISSLILLFPFTATHKILHIQFDFIENLTYGITASGSIDQAKSFPLYSMFADGWFWLLIHWDEQIDR